MRNWYALALTGAAATFGSLALCFGGCSSSDGDGPANSADAGVDSSTLDSGVVTDAGDGGGGAGGEADYSSGTRLRANVVSAAGGPALFDSWKDKTLDADCQFERAADGVLRCLPIGAYADNATFADADCTQPAVRVASGCAAPKFARAGFIATSCGVGTGVKRVGAKVMSSTVYEKASAISPCTPTVANGFEPYLIIGDVAPTELASATTKELPLTGGLAVTVATSEDGATQRLSLYDSTRKAKCERGGGSKNDRCVPTILAYEEAIYSDIGCGTVAAYFPSYIQTCDPPSAILREGLPAACGEYEAAYTEVGTKLTAATTLYRKTSTTCTPMDANPADNGSYWSAGAVVPPTSFPVVSDLDEGASAVKRRSVASGATRLLGRIFYDADHKRECTPAKTADGVERCLLTTDARTQVYEFSDDKCEKPLAHVATGCSPPAFVHNFVRPPVGTCNQDGRRYYTVAVGAKVTPAKVYEQQGVDCVEQPVPVNVDLYDASALIPPTAFGAITRTTE